MTPQFSIVTPCKGRLAFLRQALPTYVTQPDAEVIVVDYDCPDGTAGWLATHQPEVRVVAVRDAPIFNLSRARNLGVEAVRTPWVIVCDCDQLLDPGFVATIKTMLRPGTYLRSVRREGEALLIVQLPLVCESAVLRAIGGYDDAMEGWGAEDWELGRRLEQHGMAPGYFPIALVRTLDHPDTERTRFYHASDKAMSRLISHYYARIKERYFRTRSLLFDDDQRYGTYRQVKESVLRALADPALDAVFDIEIPHASPPWIARIRASEARELWQKVGTVAAPGQPDG